MLSSMRGPADGSQAPFSACEIDADRTQNLADLIVQLAGDMPALFLLNVDNPAAKVPATARPIRVILLRPCLRSVISTCATTAFRGPFAWTGVTCPTNQRCRPGAWHAYSSSKCSRSPAITSRIPFAKIRAVLGVGVRGPLANIEVAGSLGDVGITRPRSRGRNHARPD